MAAEREDFTMHAGDDKRLEITVLDEDDAAVDLTGMTAARWSLAKRPGATAVVEHSLGSNIAVVSAAAGRLNVTIDAADTEDLQPGAWYHEAEITDSAGKVGTVTFGTVTIKPALNRA